MSPDWWPHNDGLGPYYLIDAAEDGVIEERCLVPVRAIEGDEYAVVLASGGVLAAALEFIEATGRCPVADLLDEDCSLAWFGGRSWQRPTARPSGAGDGMWIDEDCGAVEFCPWVPCEPGDAGAAEFYVLEVVERELAGEGEAA